MLDEATFEASPYGAGARVLGIHREKEGEKELEVSRKGGRNGDTRHNKS
jgi:hypothetical protein